MRLWPWRSAKKIGQSKPATRAGALQELLVVCHAGDLDGMAVMENICAGLQFSKIPFAVVDLARQSGLPPAERFSTIILCTEEVWHLNQEQAKHITRYVHSGGGLFIAYRCRNQHLNNLFGFTNTKNEETMHSTGGLSFQRDFFPGVENLTLTDNDYIFVHQRYRVTRNDLFADCEILAGDLANNPLAWRRNFGDGKVIYWNTGVLSCRPIRGLVLQTIFATMKVAIAAVGGFSMLHVDDYPPALSDAVSEPVASEFGGLDQNDYFFEVWYKDMMALKEKHGLAYSWYVVMNYADVDNGADTDWNDHAITSARDILAKRFQKTPAIPDDIELGFHGYNHTPLIDSAWPDQEVLKKKLELARELWQSTMPGPMPVSFVPANNWYHRNQIDVLKQVFPELTTVCSLFSVGDVNFGEYREFGPEPWGNSFLCLPRETYGYFQTAETRMMMLSQIAGMGLWTHFLHTDDVYDTPVPDGDNRFLRNPDSRFWRAQNENGLPGLYPAFDELLTQVRSLFPWLDFVTTSQAERRFRTHIDNDVSVFISDTCVEIYCSEESLFYVRTQDGISIRPEKGGQLIDCRPVDKGNLNIVKCAAGRNLFGLNRTKGNY